MTDPIKQPHPLDVDDDAMPQSSAFQTKTFGSKVRLFCLMYLFACGLLIVVTGALSANARAASEFERSASWLNRAGMVAMLVGFMLLLLSFREPFDHAWNWSPKRHKRSPAENDTWEPLPSAPTDLLLHTRSPLSLSLLFYLMTLAAVLFATFQLLRGETLPRNLLLSSIAGGTAIGFALGGVGGAVLTRRIPATVIGGMVGLPLGSVAGMLTLIRPERFTSVVTITFIGCGVLVALALLVARFQRPSA